MEQKRSSQSPIAHAAVLIEAAALAMASIDGAPGEERFIRYYREDARIIVAAVLSQMAGIWRRPGLFSKRSPEGRILLAVLQQLRDLEAEANEPALAVSGSARPLGGAGTADFG